MKYFRIKLAKLNAFFGWNPLSAAIAFFIYAHILDVASTYFALKYLDLVEGNSLMADPTGNFLPFWAVLVKLLFATLFLGVLSYFIKRGTKNLYLASLPFWYFGLKTFFDADFNNVGHILSRLKDIWFSVY